MLLCNAFLRESEFFFRFFLSRQFFQYFMIKPLVFLLSFDKFFAFRPLSLAQFCGTLSVDYGLPSEREFMTFQYLMNRGKRGTLLLTVTILYFFSLSLQAVSYPFATFVMDANTGQELHSQNANTKLHPASLTKLMT